MATGKITKRAVDAIHPGEKVQFLWDEELRGFGIKVTPAGGKTYLIQYRLGGRNAATKRFTIGRHGSPWTPTTARDEAERLLTKVRQGVDPAADKEARERAANDFAFPAYVDRFLDLYVKREWKASYAFAESILRIHITPILRAKPLPTIRRSDLNAVFDRIPSRQAALRRNVFAVLRRLFRWARSRGDIDTDPLDGFEAPPAAASRDRVLNDEELRLVWIASGNLGYPFGPFYRLLILTGQRREEVSGLDWRELDRKNAEWNLPGPRAKNGIGTTVHLTEQAIVEIDAIAGSEKWPRTGYVFSTTGKTPISGYSRGKARLDTAIVGLAHKEAEDGADNDGMGELPAWRIHDLRRTLATGMQRLGIRFEVTEAILNHVSGSKSGVAGIYQRHDWREEKRAALRAWSSHVQKIVKKCDELSEPTNVVRLPSASGLA